MTNENREVEAEEVGVSVQLVGELGRVPLSGGPLVEA